MSSRKAGVHVLSTGRCIPSGILANSWLERIVDTSDEWIVSRTGIHERHFCSRGETTADLAAGAARQALERAGLDPAEVDVILVASVTGEFHFPALACVVQARLRCSNAWVLDVTVGCAGFLYALTVARSLLLSGQAKTALVIGADRVTSIADYTDRNTCVLFGDGAGAVVLQRVEGSSDLGLLSSRLYSDGEKAGLLYRPSNCDATPGSPRARSGTSPFLQMDGREVYKHAVADMAGAIQATLHKADLKTEDLDWVVPHQANGRITQALQERLGIESRKVYSNIDRYGNTSAASVAICLDEMSQAGLLSYGDKVMLCAFGTGFTWGAQLLTWNLPRVDGRRRSGYCTVCDRIEDCIYCAQLVEVG